MDGKVLIMTRQEALAELKDRVRCAEWVDEDYVDCVSTEALKVAIEALEKNVFKPIRTHGYQPSKGYSKPPAPPTSGSNAVKSN